MAELTTEPPGSAPPSRFDRLTGYVPTALSVVACSAIVATMVAICADVALRYFFDRPIAGVNDFVAYTIVASVFLQLGSAIRNDRLILAEFIMGRWLVERPLLAAGVNLVFYAAGAFLLYRAMIWLWQDYSKAYATGEFSGAVGAYQLILWPFKLAVVIGCAVALLEALRQVIVQALKMRRVVIDWTTAGTSVAGDTIRLAVFAVICVGFVAAMLGLGLSPIMVGVMAFAGLLMLVAIGMPIAFALLAMSFLGIWLARDNWVVANNGLGIAMSGAIRSYEFGVVPLFVLMGLLLDRADVGRDAFRVAVLFLHKVRGGLGIATVAANAIFASVTGSSMASAAVFSRISVPPMIESGYTRRFAVGVVAGSSVLGMLIPPSLLLIIYGLIAEASIGKLFIAAVLPGLLLAVAFSLVNVLLATFAKKFIGEAKPVDSDAMSRMDVVWSLAPVVFVVAVVLGGIYGGVFTPTEAGAIGALAALIVGLTRGKLDWPTLRTIVLETGYITAGILFLIIAANLYGRMLALTSIPMQMTTAIGAVALTMAAFLALYLVIVVLLGMILDSVSIMLIMLPIALPVVMALGGDPVWFGVVTVIAIEIGLLTPPFGLSVFVVKGSLPKDFVSLGDIFLGTAPFVAAMLLVTILVMIFPQISLVLL